jgi:NAD dependent epimerase/dehydratase family enzyme
MLLPFKLGVGGRVGSGEQYMSWITIDDHVGAVRHLLTADSVSGPVNLTAPEPATNAEFTRALGAAVHRPTLLPTPLLPLKAVYGSELVDTLLVEGQRVLPRVLEASGFAFGATDIESALRAVVAAPAAA